MKWASDPDSEVITGENLVFWVLVAEKQEYHNFLFEERTLSLQEKLSQLPAVDMQNAPLKLPSKLHLSAYVDFLAQSLCSMHSDCASNLG